MKSIRCICALLFFALFVVSPCHGARHRAYVNRFTVSVGENREELKVSLQTLLMSRLNSDGIEATDTPSSADIVIDGSYIVFGTVFSLDAIAKTSSGQFIDRVFVQGDTQNELIPSVAEMAKLLRRAIVKWDPALAVRPEQLVKPDSTATKGPIVQPKKESAKVGVVPVPVKVAALSKEKPWSSQPIRETYTGIVAGRDRGKDGLEIFTIGERSLNFYLKGESLQFIAEVLFEADEKVLGIDFADLDKDGHGEIYITVIKNGVPASQVYLAEEKGLRRIPGTLPYMLRGISLDGSDVRIYAQNFVPDSGFTGNLFELIKKGDDFSINRPLQLPLFGNLYNFNQFTDDKKRRFFVVTHPDGYLLVYGKESAQIWKSREKFGGSEVSLCRQEKVAQEALPSGTCNIYLPTRTAVTAGGGVIVPRNTGVSFDGAKRTYSKSSLIRLKWDGSSLREIWRSEPGQGYLADFSYDRASGRLMMLEVEPKPVPGGDRGSRIVIRNLD